MEFSNYTILFFKFW